MKRERKKGGPGSWEAVAAALSLFGGIMAALVGSLITASTWILGIELHPWLRAMGTTLLVLTIPLLIFAGYCLDWMERKLKTRPKRSSRSG